jgi:hypothetical protein
MGKLMGVVSVLSGRPAFALSLETYSTLAMLFVKSLRVQNGCALACTIVTRHSKTAMYKFDVWMSMGCRQPTTGMPLTSLNFLIRELRLLMYTSSCRLHMWSLITSAAGPNIPASMYLKLRRQRLYRQRHRRGMRSHQQAVSMTSLSGLRSQMQDSHFTAARYLLKRILATAIDQALILVAASVWYMVLRVALHELKTIQIRASFL